MPTIRQHRLRTASNFRLRYIAASCIFIAASAAALVVVAYAPEFVVWYLK